MHCTICTPNVLVHTTTTHILSGLTIKSLINVNGNWLCARAVAQFTNVSRLFYVLRREFNNLPSILCESAVCVCVPAVHSSGQSVPNAYKIDGEMCVLQRGP